MDHIETLTPETRFMDLVNQYQGFEFYQAFENDVDHIIGGKGNTYWYIISKRAKPQSPTLPPVRTEYGATA